MIRVAFILSIMIFSVWAAPTLKTMKKENRVAIVIGNSTYDDHELPSANTNARKMKKFLEKNDFYVYYGENLDKRNFVRLLRKFNKRLRPNDIGFLYFSGHSVQTKGKNYLLPLDHGILNESMIVRKSISLNSIYSSMNDSYNRLNIVVLDTSFEDPFGTIFIPEKKGLAPIKSAKAQVSFISNRANAINNSFTFTNDFLTLAQEKGLELTPMKRKLAALRQTHRQKTPQISIAKNQPFYFVLPNKIPSADELAYSKIKESRSKKELKKFLNKYPKSKYTPKAKAQLDRVSTEEAAALKEKRRRTFEAQAAEATKKAREAEAEALKTREAAAKVAAEKNEISFKLTKPEDVQKQESVKPKEGEEHQTLLE